VIEDVERRTIRNRLKALVLQIIQSFDLTEIGALTHNRPNCHAQTDQCLEENVAWQQSIVLLLCQSQVTPGR
jgi:hypothetical protein